VAATCARPSPSVSEVVRNTVLIAPFSGRDRAPARTPSSSKRIAPTWIRPLPRGSPTGLPSEQTGPTKRWQPSSRSLIPGNCGVRAEFIGRFHKNGQTFRPLARIEANLRPDWWRSHLLNVLACGNGQGCYRILRVNHRLQDIESQRVMFSAFVSHEKGMYFFSSATDFGRKGSIAQKRAP